MRVVFLAAGAGGMYCGSCLRDNRLAATLIGQGRNVSLIPLYTPLRTDEPDASLPPVHFGGIGVYMKHKWPWLRHLPAPIFKLLNHPSLIRRLGQMASKTRPEELGGLTVSVLRGRQGPLAQELDQLIEALRPQMPDFVILPNLMFIGIAEALKQSLGAKVLCTLGGEDIFLDQLPVPYRSDAFSIIRQAANDIDGFIAVTRYYGGHAASHFGLSTDQVHYVPLGIRTANLDALDERAPSNPPIIGYLARICQEKGLAVLCKAFAELRRQGMNCRLKIAGYRSPADLQYLSDCRAYLRGQGLESEFEDAGELSGEEKARFFRSIDVLSVPTVYAEAKGIFVLEAMSHGVPVVQPAHGSFPELIEDTGGGRLFAPGDISALANTLHELLRDAEQRKRHGLAGRQSVQSKYSAERMADEMWRLLEKLGR